MARARNIKPQYFINEDLPEIGIEAHFLFAGLWCLADREGRLKDRPKSIKTQLMPYYNVDVDHLLEQLATHPVGKKEKFIIRYQIEEENYIQITNFTKHQNPHINESKSTIPPHVGAEPEKHHTNTIQTPEKHGATRDDSLNSDSLNSDTSDPVPFKKITDSWNEHCGEVLPKVTTVGDGRKKHLRARWVQLGGSLEAFDKLFSLVAQSSFLTGKTNPGWQASFDWVIKNEENTAKVLEGKYTNKGPPEEPLCNGDEIIW